MPADARPPSDAPRCAAFLCCDSAYLPYSAFLADQLTQALPGCDVVIATEEALTLPGTLSGIRIEPLDLAEDYRALDTVKLPRSTWLRIFAAEALAPRYDRLIYLDSDIFADAPDLSALQTLDLRGHTLGAVRDIRQWRNPRHRMPEFDAVGAGPAPYFNAGVLVIDAPRYAGLNVRARAMDFARDTPEALPQNDQSLLNHLFRGDWAEMHPSWNWQWAGSRPLFGTWAEVRLAHFGGARKPWKDRTGVCPPRYRMAYSAFFDTHFPGQSLVEPPGPAYLQRRAGFIDMALKYLRDAPAIDRYLARFPDADTTVEP